MTSLRFLSIQRTVCRVACAIALVAAVTGFSSQAWAVSQLGATYEEDELPDFSKEFGDPTKVPQVYSYTLEGLSGELLTNVQAQLSSLSAPEGTIRSRYRAQVRSAIRTGLRALGYYNPTIKFTWSAKADDPLPQVLTAVVDKGAPVLIKSTDVQVLGPAAKEPAIEKLLQTVPKEGTVLNHGTFDSFKSDLSNLALSLGYFKARYDVSALEVAPDLNEGFWKIIYDAGPRYKFGKVTFEGSQIKESYLRNLIPFKEGDYFTAAQLNTLNENLSNIGWFNSVVVAPDIKKVNAQREIPLTGLVTPRTANSIEVGLGYSTDVGPRGSLEWERPWINQYGHSLSADLEASAKEQTLDFTYKIPREISPLQEYYLLQGGFKNTNLNDTRSQSIQLAGYRYWNLDIGWQRAVYVKWLLDNFRQADVENTTMLIYPGVSFSRTRTRGGTMPRWGDSQRISVDFSSTYWGSDIDFVVVNAQTTWVRTYWLKHRFVARANFGWMHTNDFDKVPPDLRFFAGGDRSVRGYSYESISPRDASGNLTGAKRLFTTNLEYQYNVTGKWWLATFIDAGEADNKFSTESIKYGVGVGIRWESPIGPIKLDVARPVGDPFNKSFAFYIGLGPEL